MYQTAWGPRQRLATGVGPSQRFPTSAMASEALGAEQPLSPWNCRATRLQLQPEKVGDMRPQPWRARGEMFECHPQSLCYRNLIPTSTVLGSRIFQKWLSHEDSALMNGLMLLLWDWVSYSGSQFLIKRWVQSPYPPSLTWALLPSHLFVMECCSKKANTRCISSIQTPVLQAKSISVHCKVLSLRYSALAKQKRLRQLTYWCVILGKNRPCLPQLLFYVYNSVMAHTDFDWLDIWNRAMSCHQEKVWRRLDIKGEGEKALFPFMKLWRQWEKAKHLLEAQYGIA